MGRIIAVILILFTVGCAKDKASEVSPTSSAVSVPAECVFNQTASHAFLDWGTQSADQYDCALIDKMTCALYVPSEIEKSELLCQVTNTADQATAPVGSILVNNDFSRIFLNGIGATTDAYYIGSSHGLECWFYDGAVYQDVVCKAIVD